MNGSELKMMIAHLRISQAEFARLMCVSVGAVSQWLSDARGIPGPVEAYLDLFMRLPLETRERELAKLKTGANAMRNGMYLIDFSGTGGHGYGTLTFDNGKVYGFDVAGGIYDGAVTPSITEGVVDVEINVKMPANGVSVVGGISHPFEWTLPVKTRIDLRENAGTVTVHTGLGEPIVARYQRMRDVPLAA